MDKRITKFVNVFFSVITIYVMIKQIVLKEYFSAFTCFYTLLLFLLPKILDKKFNIEFPSMLEITIYFFIFASLILGEVGKYFIIVSWWDTLLHTISGFVLTGVGIFFIDLLNKKKDVYILLSPMYVIIFAFCFSMTVLLFWEFFEYGADNILKSDMQKDTIIYSINSVNLNENYENKPINIKINDLVVNGEDWIMKYGGYIDIGLIDTMNDLFNGFFGALIFSIFGYIYLIRKNENSIIKKFILMKNID